MARLPSCGFRCLTECCSYFDVFSSIIRDFGCIFIIFNVKLAFVLIMSAPQKVVKAMIRLRVPGGSAKPGPKMGQALGPHGINMMQFCKVCVSACVSEGVSACVSE